MHQEMLGDKIWFQRSIADMATVTEILGGAGGQSPPPPPPPPHFHDRAPTFKIQLRLYCKTSLVPRQLHKIKN
jgi:hypothetical protein